MCAMRRIAGLAVVFLAGLLVVLSGGGRAAATTMPNGDLNNDGATNPIDAALILQHTAGLLPPTDEGDVSLDGQTTSVDATLVLQYSAGLLPAQLRASGLKIIDLGIGSGQEVAPDDTISVYYWGWLEDGTLIESANATPVTFRLRDLIEGWRQGVPGMRVGGTRRLIIPPELAYGEQGSGDVPPNATLIFDIQLLSIP